MKSRNASFKPRAALAGLAALAIFMAALGISCDTGAPLSLVPYSSRVTEFYPYIEPDLAASNSDFNVVYDSTGVAKGRFEMSYDADGLLVRTDVYQYDETDPSIRTLLGYYLYTYDGNGNITLGEAFSAANERGEYYEIAYNGDGNYVSIIDWVNSESGFLRTNAHYVFWLDANRYWLEQFYKYDAAGAVASLLREYQAYYDSGNRLINEIYHVIRESDGDPNSTILPSGSNEGYFYVQYSDNAEGLTYLQTDSWYGNPTVSPFIPTDLGASNRPAFNIVTPYPINPSFIGNNMNLLLTDYNLDGNWVKDSHFMQGSLQEIITYRWLDSSRITETSRYVNGGKALNQRDAVRYFDILVDGKLYAAVETTTYYLGTDPNSETSASARNASLIQRPNSERARLKPAGFSGDSLLSAYGDSIFQSMRNRHEHQ